MPNLKLGFLGPCSTWILEISRHKYSTVSQDNLPQSLTITTSLSEQFLPFAQQDHTNLWRELCLKSFWYESPQKSGSVFLYPCLGVRWQQWNHYVASSSPGWTNPSASSSSHSHAPIPSVALLWSLSSLLMSLVFKGAELNIKDPNILHESVTE